MQNKNRKNSAANSYNNGTGRPAQNISENALPDLPLNGIEQALPFPLGYSHKRKCRLSHFFDDGRYIRCLVHNADGMVEGRITRPDVANHEWQEWGLYEVNIVLLKIAETYQAEILNVDPCLCLDNDLEHVPRALCPMPAKLDELRHLVRLIQHKSLRMLVSLIYGKPHIYDRFLTAYGSRDSYTFPGGLLARTVAAGKQAIRMGFQTQEEADVVLTCALLYDVGRAFDGNLMSEDNRTLLGFVPHRKTIDIVEWELDTRDSVERSLKEIFMTGYSERYPSLHPNLKQHAALARLDTLVRIEPTKSHDRS